MNFYQFHIGDYAAHTRHLSPMEDLAYRRMLDAYYLHEGPLVGSPADVARLVGMREQVAEVEAVLREFFDGDAAGWKHGRCDEELQRFRAMSEGGRKGAASRWGGHRGANGVAMGGPSTPHRPPNANHEPIPMNQEPQMDGWMDGLSLISQKQKNPNRSSSEGDVGPADDIAASRALLEASRKARAARSGGRG